MLAAAGTVEARLKYYRYNDNIPMVEMSLNMMVAMGVLEPIPSRLVYDGNPYNRLVSDRAGRYSRASYNYPRSGLSSRYRYNDYWDEPVRPYRRYSRSRYGYEPDLWDHSWADHWDAPRNTSWGRWNSPRYSSWDSPWYSNWGSRGAYSPWTSQWDNPWYRSGVNPWSNQWTMPWSSPYGYSNSWPIMPGYSSIPLLPNELLDDSWRNTMPYQFEEPASQINGNNGARGQKTSWSSRPSRYTYKRISQRGRSNTNYRRLNGLWIDNNGEMLGIRDNQFLWYDNNRYAKGQLIKSPTMMEARISENRTVVRFRYKLKGNEMVIMSRDGKMRSFSRMPMIQARHAAARHDAAHSGYRQGSDNLHVQHYRYQSGPEALKIVYPRVQAGADREVADFTAYKASYNVAPLMNRVIMPQVPGHHHTETSNPAEADNDTGVATADVSAAVATDIAMTAANPDTDVDAVLPATADDSKEKQAAVEQPAGVDPDDPYTYLFSYLKDSETTVETATDAGNADAAVDIENSNIWKPNNLFPHRRRDAEASADNDGANHQDNKELVWSGPGSWD